MPRLSKYLVEELAAWTSSSTCSAVDRDTHRPRGGDRGRRGGHLGDLGRVQVVAVAILLIACWQTVDAELVFHRRDQRDQGRHEATRRTHQVTNYTEAVQYLQKYGYLEHCRLRNSSSRPKRLAPELRAGITEDRMPECSAQMVADALRLLQQRFDLTPSGRLDNATRGLMSRGRCGNSDVDDEQRKRRRRRRRRRGAGLPEPIAATPGPQPSLPSDGGSGKSPWELLTGSRVERKRRFRDGRDSPKTEDDDDDEVFSEGIDLDHHPRTSKRRRQELLREITARVRRSDVASNDDEMTSSLRHRRHHHHHHHQRFQLLKRARRMRRKKRTISILSMGEMSEGSSGDKVKFQKDENSPVQWRLLDDGVSGKIPLDDQRAILELSFRMWSEVIPLKFVEANDVSINDVDVIIAFAKQSHMNCDKPFDGLGGELAHSWTGGDIHFDEDENYKRVDPTGTGIDLLKVAVHEVGHVLGLLHNDKTHSIMYPIYVNPPADVYEDFELSLDDRRAVQKIYGVCKGSFDAVFDWLRKVPSPQGPPHRPRYIFNTYFFRSNRYWMYENRFNRTRFGDPLYVSRGWTGVPDPVDAYAQVITANGQEYDIDTYFFVGDSYYKYNDESDRIEDGYPRKISEDFGAKSTGNESIPDDLDAVLFDNRDSLLYFFKGDWVWTFDPTQIGKNGCCEGKRRFSDLFPVDNLTLTTDDDPLDGDLDTVFYSYHFHTIFFFKGETVYENAAYNEKTPRVNRLKRLGAWYQTWFDICDVE